VDERLADFYDDLPVGWSSRTFADILIGPVRNGIYKPAEFHGDGARIVNMGELFAYPRLRDVEMRRLRVTGAELAKAGLSAGDLMFARRSLVAEGAGKCSLVLEVPEPTVFESSIIRARPDPAQADSSFLYYLFCGQVGRHLLGSILRQTSVSGITGSDLSQLPIPVPPIEEQRAIADVLGALDDKVELNGQMNRTLEEMASALFKSWFVDFDPVVAKADGRKPFGMDATTAALFPSAFVAEPSWGDIPKGWSTLPLDEVADFRNGLALQNFRPGIGEDRLPVIKIAQLRTGRADGDEWAKADIDPSCVLEDGDIVFSWSGSLAVVVWCGGKGALNQHLFRVTSARCPKWLFHQWTLFHLPEFQGIAADKATTMGHIRRFHLTEARCVVPPAPVLAAADRRMSPWLDLFIANELESRTLTALRDTLLPKLLSGEIRLKQAEKLVGAAL
jgi:type I restriction enzyme S subunit